MKRLILGTLTAAMIAAAPASFAQTAGGTRTETCRPEQGRCVAKVVPATKAQASKAPQTGDSGKGGQRFDRAKNSRFKAPPQGQEYRVVQNHLVTVDSKTLKIITVVGLLDTLLK